MKLRKWLNLSGSIVLGGFGFAVAMSVITVLTVSGKDNVISVFYNLPYNFEVGCMLFCAIMSLTVYKNYLPMCLSMGSRRLDAFVGMQIMSRLPAVAAIAFGTIFCLIFKNDTTAMFLASWKTTLLQLLISGILGSLLGCLWSRFGRVGAIITVIFMACVGGVMGFFGGVSTSGDINLSAVLGNAIGKKGGVILAAVTVVLWGVELIISRNTLKNYEVKL